MSNTITSIWGYKCPSCDFFYEDTIDAAGCCDGLEAQGWKCDECDEIYLDEFSASECCGGSEEDDE